MIVTALTIPGCFNELPVNYTGVTLFMGPKNHVLQKTPTPVSCSMLIKPTFKLPGSWFSSNAGLTHVHSLPVLTTGNDVRWTYTNAGDLANEGIYSADDLGKLRRQLMYPWEESYITNDFIGYQWWFAPGWFINVQKLDVCRRHWKFSTQILWLNVEQIPSVWKSLLWTIWSTLNFQDH